MLEYMENISQSEAENIRKTIQDLFRQTCILQTKCDPVTLIQKDNPHYQVCARNREFIADYLQVLDCELVHDPQEHIFRITGDGVLTERMTLLTTKLVILMKLIYRDKIMGEGLHATTTSLAEIRRYGKETNLITRRLTAQEWQEALILMKTHQMIELPSAIGNLEDDSPIYISIISNRSTFILFNKFIPQFIFTVPLIFSVQRQISMSWLKCSKEKPGKRKNKRKQSIRKRRRISGKHKTK